MKDKVITAAIQAALLLSTSSALLTSTSALAAEDANEKCYGVIKAGMNDCATATASCAGSATKDSQPDAFIFMPQGMCDKIVGASTKPIASQNTSATNGATQAPATTEHK